MTYVQHAGTFEEKDVNIMKMKYQAKYSPGKIPLGFEILLRFNVDIYEYRRKI